MLEHVERTGPHEMNGRGLVMETQIEGHGNKRLVILPTKKSPFYLPKEAARYLRLCPKTLEKYRIAGTGPTYRRHGGKVCYHEDDLEGWSLNQTEDV